MSNVQFEEESRFMSNNYSTQSRHTGFANLLVRKGFSKDTRSANIILVVIALLSFSATFFLLTKENIPNQNTYSKDNTPTIDPLPSSLLQPTN